MTTPEGLARTREELTALSRELGDPRNDWAILAEGNTSAIVDSDEFLLKASGASLGSATPESFVRVRFEAVFQLLDQPPSSDEERTAALVGCLAEPGTLRPSVEAALHALALTIGGGGTWATPIQRP
jgi:rhamnose utilization protein RhaD (predicted bifunctional aldolase and dehydrogenase)